MFECATYFLFVFFSYGSCNVFAENDILQDPLISSYDRLKKLGEMCLIDILPILENISEQQKEGYTANFRIFNETQGILDRIEGHQEVNDKQLKALKVKMEGHFMDLHAKMEIKVKKLSLEKSLRKALNALQCSLDTRNVSSKVSLHPEFEKVGSRFFYIERHVKQNWFDAMTKCREMGGHLASPQNEEELHLISQKLDTESYWLDLSDLTDHGQYISLVSGSKAPFLKWNKGQPNRENAQCVRVKGGLYQTFQCDHRVLFICQANQNRKKKMK